MNIGFFIKSTKSYNAHIAPIIENAPIQDINHFIFHIDRVYSPGYRNETIKIKTVDLSTEINIINTLKTFELDILVFLSPGHLYELLLVNICKQLSIISIFFQHGLSLDLSSFNLKSFFQEKSIARKLGSVKKMIFFYFSIISSSFFINNRYLLFKTVLHKSMRYFIYYFRPDILYRFPKYGLRFIHCNYAFVYGKKDMDYLIESMEMDSNNIIISGYPFLTPMLDHCHSSDRKSVLYLSSAFREDGIIPISINDEKNFYLLLYKQIKKAGFKLDIKVHPRDNFDLIKSYFENDINVKIYKNKNLADMTISSRYVISDFSTALFYAIKYFKPIIILNSEHFDNYPFDYTDYGIGTKTDLKDLYSILKNGLVLSDKNNESYRKFLTNYLFDNSKINAFEIFYSKIISILNINNYKGKLNVQK